MAAITPLVPITPIEQIIKLNSILPEKPKEVEEKTYSFSDILKGMVNNVNETDAVTKTDAFNIAMGNVDIQDLANIEINAIRADMALRSVTSVRNKVLEAYSEIMRITI